MKTKFIQKGRIRNPLFFLVDRDKIRQKMKKLET